MYLRLAFFYSLFYDEFVFHKNSNIPIYKIILYNSDLNS